MRQSGSYSDSSVASEMLFAQACSFSCCGLDTCLFQLQDIFGLALLRSRILEMESAMLVVHRFHNNIQLHYIYVLLVLVEGQRHHVGSGYNTYFTQSW